MTGLVSEEDIQRARTDPQFRQELMAQGLEMLLVALNRMHHGEAAPQNAKLMSEGTKLALQLADQIQKMTGAPGPKAA